MANSDILNYLSEGLRNGYGLEPLRQNLLEAGFQESDINEAVQNISMQNSPIQTSPESSPSWLRRHWLLTTILILIVIGVISGIMTFKSSSPTGPSSSQSSGTTQSQNQFACPQLSNLAFYDYVSTDQYAPDGTPMGKINTSTWVVQTVDYSTKDEKLVYAGAQEGYGNNENISVIFCENGSTFIQNGEDASKYIPNDIYCGNLVAPIVLYKLDSSRNIINNTKTSVQISFDSKTKSYVTTRCGTYDTVNAP